MNRSTLQFIPLFNRMPGDFQRNPFHVLYIMSNTTQDVKDFNAPEDNNSEGNQLRRTLNFSRIEVPVLAVCNSRKSDNSLAAACDNVAKDYSINMYPTTLIIDKKGVIRYAYKGAVSKDRMEEWYNEIAQQVNILLKEPE